MREQYVGKSFGRTEGLDKASGRAMYAGDYYAENMLYVAVVRSPIAHGRITGMDCSGLPEDVFFFTGKDLAENVVDDIIQDTPIFAGEHVRYHNEPIAAVAADSMEKAKAAAASVKISYEEYPVVLDAMEAARPDAPQIHENGNELTHFFNEKGNTEEAFASCDITVEGTFHLPTQDHGYMEPEACFAFVGEDGMLHAWTSSQNIFADRRIICRALGLTEEQVHTKAAAVGGGFGGKDGHMNQVFTALAAWKTGRPAKCVFDRTESLTASFKRHAATVYVKIGADRQGNLLAFEGTGYLDTGAYAGLGTAVLALYSEHLAGPYEIPNVKIESYLMYTNKTPSHAMRGFGAPQGAFATEQLLNQLAVKLDMDPIDLRYKNALQTGSIGALGQKMEHCVGMREALDMVRSSDLWKERKNNTDPYIGYGIAGGHLSCGLGKNIPDSAKVKIKKTGEHYDVYVGLVDIGQGSQTVFQALAADALETSYEHVTVHMADSAVCYDCGSTAGSRSSYIGGNAILDAAKKIKDQGLEEAEGSADFPESATAFKVAGFPHAMYTFMAQAVKVRLNPVTGEVEVLDTYAATEAGRVINPLGLAGQMQGGTVQSVGYALMEECRFDEQGRMLNRDLSTYLLPSSMDVGTIKSEGVDALEHSGPAGAKGAAEVATVSIAPAIGNAIYEISGVMPEVLPFDKYKLLTSLEKRKETKGGTK